MHDHARLSPLRAPGTITRSGLCGAMYCVDDGSNLIMPARGRFTIGHSGYLKSNFRLGCYLIYRNPRVYPSHESLQYGISRKTHYDFVSLNQISQAHYRI